MRGDDGDVAVPDGGTRRGDGQGGGRVRADRRGDADRAEPVQVAGGVPAVPGTGVGPGSAGVARRHPPGGRDGLADSVRTAAVPPADARVREAMAEFMSPLSWMLLVFAGLREALAGHLDDVPADNRLPAATGPMQPRRWVPTPAESGAQQVYGDIRAALRTPLVNSIWLSLAGRGLLDAAWHEVAGQVPQTRQRAAALGQRATQTAQELAWPVVVSPRPRPRPASPTQAPAWRRSWTATSRRCRGCSRWWPAAQGRDHGAGPPGPSAERMPVGRAA